MRGTTETIEAKRPTRFDLAGLAVSVANQHLVGPLTLSLTAGDGMVLSGPMGAGKSLVCEYLAGLHRPGLSYAGEMGFRDDDGSATAGRTALAPQDWRLVALSTDRVQTLLAGRARQVGDELDRLEIDLDRIHELKVVALAASERLRVLLACALADEAHLTIVDGPADVLDPRQRGLVSAAMEAAVSRGTMLIVTARDGAPWVPGAFRHVQIGEPVGAEAVAVPLMQKRKEETRAVAKPPALDVAELDIERRRSGFFSATAKPARIVDGASMFVRSGEILVLLGPSGSGKSTLLAAMAGHIPSQAGRIRIAGVDVTSARGQRVEAVRTRVQLVSMEMVRSLDPSCTVGDHLRGALPKGSGSMAAPWLERLGLPAELSLAMPDNLSEGEAFRFGLALALSTDPRVVLLDAPRSGALDADGGILTGLLLAEKAHGRSFVLATSDPGISRSLADRIAILDAGRVLEFGPTSLVLGRPAHPRTLTLLRSEPGPHHDPRSPRGGCHVAGACPREVERCRTERPLLDFVPGATRNHRVACFSPNLDAVDA